LLLAALACLGLLLIWSLWSFGVKRIVWAAIWAGVWLAASMHIFTPRGIAASLQSGLLDPLPLLHRSVNLLVMPLIEPAGAGFNQALYWPKGAWLIGAVFLAALLLNLIVPRFYCRFICPLGALFGLLARLAPLRIAKLREPCSDCRRCETACQGACAPPDKIQGGECHLCLNCRKICPEGVMGYGPAPSAAGEQRGLDLGRRKLVLTMFGGLALPPVLRLGGLASASPPAFAPARRLARGPIPGPLHQVRPMHAHLPHRGDPASPDRVWN
jgi:ferredoxin